MKTNIVQEMFEMDVFLIIHKSRNNMHDLSNKNSPFQYFYFMIVALVNGRLGMNFVVQALNCYDMHVYLGKQT